MLAIIGQAVEFVAYFTCSKLGKTGLVDVSVDVYDQDNAQIKSAEAATEIGTTGLYRYVLPAAAFDALGNYKAMFKTANPDVDYQHVPAMWVAVGQLSIGEGEPEDPAAGILDDTLAGLLAMLRIRLNDVDQGNYSTVELMYCINMAYRETVVLTLCHKPTATIQLVAAQHTYDIVDATDAYLKIFEPIEVLIGAEQLTRRNLGDMGVTIERWSAESPGVPTDWMHLTGNQLRIHPTPNAGAVKAISTINPTPVVKGTGYAPGEILRVNGGTGGTIRVSEISGDGFAEALELVTSGYDYEVETKTTITTKPNGGSGCTVAIATIGELSVVGYAQPKPLLLPVDRPVALQDSHSVQVILDRAEAEARKCRITTSQNAVLYERLMASWKSWCEKSRETARGKA